MKILKNILKKLLCILLCTVYNITYSCDDFDAVFNQLFNNIDKVVDKHTIIIPNTDTQYAIATINNEQHQPCFTQVEYEKFIVIKVDNNKFLNRKRKRPKEIEMKSKKKTVSEYDDLNMDSNTIELDENKQSI